jgi:PadR family transcriptional regulator, regulatory protein PadR
MGDESRIGFLVAFLWYLHRSLWHTSVAVPQVSQMSPEKLDLLQGTLDLMVLQTLTVMGSLHGYGIARRIEQVSGNEVLLNQGTIYASLVRLEQREWIASRWGTSDNNRKAKFYSITAAGRRQLTADARYWERLKDVMQRVMTMDKSAEGGADA